MQETLNRTQHFFNNELERQRYVDAEIACMGHASAIQGSREKVRLEEQKEVQNTLIPQLIREGASPESLARIFSFSLENVIAIAKQHGITPVP